MNLRVSPISNIVASQRKCQPLPVLGVNESEVLSIKVNPRLPLPNSAVHLSVLRLKLLESCPHMSVMVVDKLLSRVHCIDVVRGLPRTGPAVAALAQEQVENFIRWFVWTEVL